MSEHKMMAAFDVAPEDVHCCAVKAMAAAAPSESKGQLADLISRAFGAGIPWFKIMQAVAIIVAGNFSAESFAAAIALLFGATSTA